MEYQQLSAIITLLLFHWAEMGCHCAEIPTSFASVANKCGISQKYFQKIIGGEKAKLGDWPWSVALYNKNPFGKMEFACGGSLISDRYVITAAHCITDRINMVRLGIVNVDVNEKSKNGTGAVDVLIEKTIIHSSYKFQSIKNDIALILLQHPVRFNNHIRPICLPRGDVYQKEEFYKDKEVYVAGWGRSKPNELYSLVLLDVLTTVVNNSMCNEPMLCGGTQCFDETTLCAGQIGKGACKGDSGSSLVISEKREEKMIFSLVGIVSAGLPCFALPENNYPSVFTKVAPYLQWIDDVITKEKPTEKTWNFFNLWGYGYRYF